MKKWQRNRIKQNHGSYADEYIRNFLTKECIPGIQKEFEITGDFLPDITLEEINNLGKEWTTDENMVALITAQEKEGVKVPSEVRLKRLLSRLKAKKIEAYVDKVSDVPLLS